MNSYFSRAITFSLVALFSANIQAQETEIPFLSNDPVNPSHFYYPNQGQIADDDGNLHPEVLFYTEMTSPSYYFHNNKVSFTTLRLDSINPDTSLRIDMEFYQGTPSINVNEAVDNPVPKNQKEEHLNYYLPHCSEGIEQVHGYERLVYEDAYPDIDVEFTSNISGLKARFIVQPSADPDDILLKFTGQDNITEHPNGDIEFLLSSWELKFKQAYAYQVSNGQPFLVNWTPLWVHDGNGIVSITTGSYNADLPLIIEMGGPDLASPSGLSGSSTPAHWGTYYGGEGIDENKDFDIDQVGNFYTLSNVKGSGASFPALDGVTYPNNLSFNIMISKFYPYEEREYATYIGGTEDDNGMAIAYQVVPDAEGNIYIGGYTLSDNLENGQSTSTFNQTKQQGLDGLLMKFEASLGLKLWVSYFGGNGSEFIMDMKASVEELYICGVTSSTNTGNCSGSAGMPMCNSLGNSFYQNSNQGGKEAFVAQFSAKPLQQIQLEWSTFLGGDQNDRAYSIAYKYNSATQENDIYLAGKTSTSQTTGSYTSPVSANSNGSFPLADPQGGAYFQSVLGATASTSVADGFLAKFNDQRQLVWSTFYGGDGDDQFSDIATNGNGVTVVGYTESSTDNSGTCTTNLNGDIPKCATSPTAYTASNQGMRDVLITQFNDAGVLHWSTCYGGTGQEAYYGFVNCVSDQEDNVYVTANSLPNPSSPSNMSTNDPGGVYYQFDNQHITESGNGSDNILLMFDEDNTRLWSTYYGGGCSGCTDDQGDEYVEALTVFNSEWIYFGGNTRSLNTPRHQSWAGAYYDDQQGSILSNTRVNDGYIAKVNVTDLALFLEELTQKGTIDYLEGYPNPAINNIQVQMPFTQSIEVELIIYNNGGQEIQRIATFTEGNRLNLDITSLKSGVYFMRIEPKNDPNTKKYVYSFIKQ
ncbi:T9SS type A sorting domain-containing protein [bacterium SCSIO 12643]|nr:T9SS type A sorting domain-containing protein [bacterium SCSIO 12643]